MTSNGQKEKIGDNTLVGSGKPIDLDIEGDNHNAETYDQGHGDKDVGQTDDGPKKPDQTRYYKEDDFQVWKDRCLRKDEEVKEMATNWRTCSRSSIL
ncbi:hypothetical protein ACSBR2_037843 [Camellia fascicularis]